MKIELSPVLSDKDTPPKSPKDGAVRGAQGEAFDKAVRNAGPKGRAKDEVKDPSATPGEAKAADEGEAKAAEAGEAKATDAAASDAAAPADPKDLRSLLGLLAGAVSAPAEAKAEPAAAGDAPARLRVDEKAAAAVALDAAGEEPASAKAVRLEVLRMETHFEPRQDGAVLVETAKAKQAADAAKSSRAAAAGSSQALSATLTAAADKAGALAALVRATSEPGGAKASIGAGAVRSAADGEASAAAAGEGDTVVPLRFGEAVARLGAGSGQRESSRDGSAASQAAAVETTARRADLKAADAGAATTANAPAIGTGGLADQVVGRIVEALGGDRGSAAPSTFAAPGETHLRMRAGGAALKTLTIQLQPEHLGTLEVSMRLSEGQLTLELSASQSDTAELLSQDRASLRKMLEHAGFALDDASITVVTKDAAAPAAKGSETGGGAPRDASPGGGGQGSGDADARSSSGSSGGEPQSRRQSRGGPNEAPAERRPGASTYL